MSTQRVNHGQTFALTGTLASTSTLLGLSGNPGALIEVTGTATNKGVITLTGAQAPHKHGATLTDPGVLTNAGLITINGATNSTHAALLRIDGALTNTGILAAQAGTYGVGANMLIVGGGVLRNDATLTLAAGVTAGSLGATLTDMGVLINRANGVIDVAGSSGQAYLGNGGGASIVVTDSFTNQGKLILYDAPGHGAAGAATLSIDGVMENSGSVLVGGARQYYSFAEALLAVSGSLTNTGTIAVTGGVGTLNYTGPPPQGATLAVTGMLDNQGQIDLQGAIEGRYGAFGALLTDPGTLVNSGTLTIGGGPGYNFYEGASVLINGVLTNTGAIEDLQFSHIVVAGSLTNAGTLTASGAARFYGPYHNAYFSAGGSIAVSGVLSNNAAGTMTLQGGISEISAPYVYPLDGPGASLSVTGKLFNNGTLTIGGGDGGVPNRLSGYDIGLGAQLSLAAGGLLNNVGTIEIQQGSTSSYGVYGGGGLLTVAGALYVNRYETYTSTKSVITIHGGAGASTGELLITDTGYLGINGIINGSGVLLNQGSISTESHASIFTTTLINDGTVALHYFHNAFTISGAISADPGKTGVLSLYNRNSLTLDGPVAASQTVVFQYPRSPQDPQNELQLASAATFAGTLSGIAATDMIDFLKQDITSATTTGDTLTIGLAAGGTIDLALATPLAGLSLMLQSDQGGGTDLLFSASAPAP